MQEINKSVNSMEKFNQFILKIFNKYEMGEAYSILNGVDLVGVKNCENWLSLVEQMEEIRGLSFLPNCIALMKNIDKKTLVSAIENQQNPSYSSFEEFLFGFSDTIEEKSKSNSL